MPGRDTVEFQQLFEPLYRQCHALGWRLLRDDERAEMVATEAMARAYARWSKVRSLPHPEGWTLRVAGQLAVEALADDPGTADELALAVAALPAGCRDVVVLRFLTALDSNEVGLALSMAPESVQAALREGLAELRTRLGGKGGAGVSAA